MPNQVLHGPVMGFDREFDRDARMLGRPFLITTKSPSLWHLDPGLGCKMRCLRLLTPVPASFVAAEGPGTFSALLSKGRGRPTFRAPCKAM